MPYVHVIFTLPHKLNGLARNNPSEIYGLIMQASWQAVKATTADPSNVGALPGMVSVLHTFGSDMKYHVHVHSLVTFGGIDARGKWQYPRRRSKLYPYRSICKAYRDTFMAGLKSRYRQGKITYHMSYDQVAALVGDKRWVVHNTYPSADTSTLETYLARYINRVAITNSCLKYIAEQQQVQILYNDYRRQVKGHAAPKAYRQLKPLTAIDQILQHVLPAYLQKSRRYGLHHASTRKRLKDKLTSLVRNNGHTIRTVMQIIKDLLGVEQITCEHCAGTSFTITTIPPDRAYLSRYARPQTRDP